MLSSINLEIAPELRLTSYAALDDLLVLLEHWFIFLCVKRPVISLCLHFEFYI